ncbi:MAG: hypothetical protein JW839_05415 [Candidatus Lokiarchaeota archaeon]|nr:hypothetical protein [Candidatus Lokiarchaeota archaeon]
MILPVTTAESWQTYKALIDGVADWGGQTTSEGIDPARPQTWSGHIPTLEGALRGRWQQYVQDPSIAARDQLSFRNHVILALAAEKTRVLALGGVSAAEPVSQPRITHPAGPVASSGAAVLLQPAAPAQQLRPPVFQYSQAGSEGRVETLLNEAREYRKARKWSLAKDAYSQALAIQPGNPEAKEGMSVTTQKASMKMLAIMMPIMCAGGVAFILIFLSLALSL